MSPWLESATFRSHFEHSLTRFSLGGQTSFKGIWELRATLLLCIRYRRGSGRWARSAYPPFPRQPGWIERRRDGGLTDTGNFLMQPFCNSREETGCSPFYPMNQHDPIFAYKPSQLSLLPLAPNNSDGLIIEFTSFTFLPRRGTGFVHEATCCGVPRPCKKWRNRNESEWWSKLCLSFREGTFLPIICTRRWIHWYYKWQVNLLILFTSHLGLTCENLREMCDSIGASMGEISLSLIVVTHYR